jgi:DNA-binding response OmpR family regulator
MARTILAVDDNPVIRETLAIWLSAAGHQVVCAPSGLDAVQLLEQRKFDLVILDVEMPGLTGFDVLAMAQRRTLCPGTPIMMLTASDYADDIVRARDLGACGYLNKPFSPEGLLDKIERVLEARDTLWIDDFHCIVGQASDGAAVKAPRAA